MIGLPDSSRNEFGDRFQRDGIQPDLAPTLPRFVGLDYSWNAVPVCVLDNRGKVLGNHA